MKKGYIISILFIIIILAGHVEKVTALSVEEIWYEYQAKNQLSGYLEFVEQYPNHPRSLDGMEIIQSRILKEYKDYFWDLNRYQSIDKDSSGYEGFLANTNNAEKIELFKKLSQFGFSKANWILSDIYYLGVDEYNPQKAYDYASKAADDEYIFGIIQQAKFQYLGIGTDINQILANETFKKHLPFLNSMISREKEHFYSNLEIILAQYFLGWIKNRDSETFKNKQEALFHYAIAAAAGHISAQYNMALQYLKGRFLAQNVEYAEEIIGKFASLGFKRAQNNLKWMYDSGKHSGQFLKYLIIWHKPPEKVFWKYVMDSNDQLLLNQFVKFYPQSTNVAVIIKRLEKFNIIE